MSQLYLPRASAILFKPNKLLISFTKHSQNILQFQLETNIHWCTEWDISNKILRQLHCFWSCSRLTTGKQLYLMQSNYIPFKEHSPSWVLNLWIMFSWKLANKKIAAAKTALKWTNTVKHTLQKLHQEVLHRLHHLSHHQYWKMSKH